MALQKTGISLEAQGSSAFFAVIKAANEAVASMGAGALKAAGGVDAFADAAKRAAKVADLEGKLSTQRKELGILQKELEQTAAKYGEGSTQAQRKALAVEKLSNSIQGTERALASEQRELVAAASATQDAGQAADKAAPQIKDLGQVAEHAGKGFNALGEVAIGALREIGAGLVEMAAEGAKAFAAFTVDSVKMAGDFDAGLRTLGAVAGDSMADAGVSLDTFREKALQLGADTKYSADEALTAMTELAKGGVPITEVLGGATEAVLNLAAAGGVELGPASEIVAKNLAIWSREGVTAADVTNLIAQAANASTVGVEELGSGMANAQGTAQAMGLEYKDFVTTMALLAPAFDSSQEAGTSFKNFLVRLQPQTKPAREAMRELGLLTAEGTSKFIDAQGAYVGGAKAADLLAQATAGLTDAKRAELLQLVFGNDGMGAANQLLQEGAAGYERITGAMAAAGTAAEQAGKMNEGFNAIMDALGGTIDTVKIRIGTALLPILSTLTNNYLIPAINVVGDLVKAFAAFGGGDTFTGFTTLSGIVKPFSETLAGIFAQAATASDPFGTLKQALTDTYPGFATLLDVGTKIGDAFASIMTKAGEVGTALAAFGTGDSFTGFTTLAGVVKPLSDDLADLLATAATSSEPFKTFKEGIDEAIPGLSIMRGLLSTTAKDLQAISEAVAGAKSALDTFSQTKLGEGLLGDIQNLKGEFPPLGLSIGGSIRNIQAAIDGLSSTPFGQELIANTKQAFLDFANESPTLGAGIIGGIISGLTGGVGGLVGAVRTNSEAIRQAWNDFTSGTPSLGSAVIEGIITGLTGGVGGIAAAVKGLGESGRQAWNDFVSGTPSLGSAAIEGIITGLTGGVGGIFKAFATLADEGERAWNTLVDDAPGIGRAVVTGIITGVTGGASGLFSAVAGLAKNAYKSAMGALLASSPSQLFADGPGDAIPTGMAQGVTAGTTAATAAVSSMVDRVFAAANTRLGGETKFGTKVVEIARSAAQKLIAIDQSTQQKLIAIDQRGAAERTRAMQQLYGDMERMSAATAVAQQLNDLDAFTATTEEQQAQFAAREAAEVAYNARIAAAQQEARDTAAAGDAELAKEVLDARTKAAQQQMQLEQDAAKVRAEAGEGATEAINQQVQEASQAIEAEAQVQIDLAQAAADQRGGAVEAEKLAVIAAAEDQKTKVIAAAEESMGKVKGASAETTSAVVGGFQAQGQAARDAMADVQAYGSAISNLPGVPSGGGGSGGGGGSVDVEAAGGGSFLASGPTKFLAGEKPGNPELVTVTPLGTPGTTKVRGGVPQFAGGGTLLNMGNIASLFSDPGGMSGGMSGLGIIANDALSLKNALLLANKSATYLAGGMLKLGDTTGLSAAKLREQEEAVGRATEGLQRHLVAGLKNETIERRQTAQTELLEKQTMHAVDAFLNLNPAIDGAGLAALVTSGQLDQMTAELIKQEQETREAERALAAFGKMLESVDASVVQLTANLNAFSTAAQAIDRIRGMADAVRDVAALTEGDETQDRRDGLRDAITEEEEYQKKRAEILAASDFEEDYYNEAGELVMGRRSKLAALEAEYSQDGMSATERRIAAEHALAAEIDRVTAALALQAQAQADLAAAREEASRIRAMDQELGNEYNALRNQQILELAGLERERIDLAARAAAGDAGAAAQLAALDRQIALIKEAHTLEIQAFRDRAREQIIAGVAAANGIEVGMVEQTPALLAYVDDLMQQIIAATQGALGIASPSKVFAQMGKQTLWGFAKPFTDGNVIGDVLRGVDSAMDKVIVGAGQALGQALPAATTIRPAAMGGGGNTSYHYGGATTYQMDARGSNWSKPQLEGIVRGVVDRTARSADGTRRTGGYGRRI